ncbi:uncharacterized protein LOC126597552 [Malus sylvestris]|uniref:uncharacterized protein LOC126597552 n=1 Tax=Malus sylvestris TaxID=3752 RepID=UPI0021AC547A|nr:uncharacterized protein LOC126597552 [Malus sylvestris]
MAYATPISSTSSDSSSSTMTTPIISLPTTFNISHTINTPMDRNNYLSWRSQFQDILEIHGMEDVVTINSKPPKKLDDGSVNPHYSRDKLVLSWIKATCISSIQTILIPCTYAYNAWTFLEKRLSPLSKTHILTLRDQLRTLKKDSEKPMSDYLMHAKSLADSLNTAGSSISEDDLIECLLDGLGPEYKEFTTAVHLRPSLLYDDFYDLLIQEENLIKKMSSFSLSNDVAFTAHHRFNGPSKSISNGNRFSFSNRSFSHGQGCDRHRPGGAWRSSNSHR